MPVITIVKDALVTLRKHPSLWVFGFFAAAGGGTGARMSRDGEGAPEWLVPLLVVAAVVGLLVTAMNIVSEGALIDGVRRTRRGDDYRLRTGIRAGLSFFWRMVGVKLSALAAALVTVAAILLPVGAVVIAGGPVWAGALGTAALALTLLPWLLSVYFVYELAMRIVVVEERGVRDAIGEGFRFLQGRVLLSLQIAVAAGLGQFAAGALGLVLALPVAILAGLVYLLGGPIAAAIAFGIVMTPLAICLVGALGTYRSSVWTHGYLRGRGLPA
jgi:hypothetical protein